MGPPELRHLAVSLLNVKLHHVVQLVETHGAEEGGALVGLLQVVGAIHQAFKEDTVADPVHVADFMTHNFTCSSDERCFTTFLSV